MDQYKFMTLSDEDAYQYIAATFTPYQQTMEEITWALRRIRSYFGCSSVDVNTVMEIGSYSGGNLPMLSRLFTDNGLLISIEPDPPGRAGHLQHDDINELVQSHQFIHIKGRSDDPMVISEVDELLTDRGLNVLFIDGGHLYDEAKYDYDTYSKYVSNPGIIIIHDVTFMHNSKCDCVGSYWNHIKRYHPYESKYMCKVRGLAGIGILYIGEWNNEV